jgi:hypothetical protein
MAHDEATTASGRTEAATEPLFTLARANRALILVHRVVAAIVSHYQALMSLRREREELPIVSGRHERAEELNDRMARCIEELNDLNRELMVIGCVLKDWHSGLVDFPPFYRGRRVWLCWRLGETRVQHWHDLNAGFADRAPLPEDFD